MSRTIRRKQGHGWAYGDYSLKDAMRKLTRVDNGRGFWRYVWVPVDQHSKEGKKLKAKYHSDATTVTKRGPGWFITMRQRAYRRSAKQDIEKYVRDEEHEVQIRRKPKLEYWW